MVSALVTQPCLCIDSSSDFLSISIQHNQVFSLDKKVRNQHSDYIIPFIDQLLKEAKLTINEIKTILYAKGPGSFTGLRIALSVIKGLSSVKKIPIIGVPTLDYIAYQYYNQNQFNATHIIAAIDARMHEVFYAGYQTNNFTRITEYLVSSYENQDWLNLIQQPNTILIGNGFNFLRNTTNNLMLLDSMPTADLLFKIANEQQCYPIDTSLTANLLYVRNKVALTERERNQK